MKRVWFLFILMISKLDFPDGVIGYPGYVGLIYFHCFYLAIVMECIKCVKVGFGKVDGIEPVGDL